MSTQSILNRDEYLCREIQESYLCLSNQIINFKRYGVGKDVSDFDLFLFTKLADLIQFPKPGLEDCRDVISQKMNELINRIA